MEFPDVNTQEGIQFLDSYFLSKSYVSDYQPTQNDVSVFRAVSKEPSEQFPNVLRWYRHIKNFGSARKDLPQATKSISIKSETSKKDTEVSVLQQMCTYIIILLLNCLFRVILSIFNLPLLHPLPAYCLLNRILDFIIILSK